MRRGAYRNTCIELEMQPYTTAVVVVQYIAKKTLAIDHGDKKN